MSMAEVAGTQQRGRERIAQRLGHLLHPRRDTVRRPAAPCQPAPPPKRSTTSHALELADRPAMHAAIATTRDSEIVLSSFVRAGVTLPDELRLAPSRLECGDHICAAGFVDARSSGVTVDIALWALPSPASLDAGTWRSIFDWVMGPDDGIRLTRVSGTLTVAPSSVSGDYLYEYARDGQVGHGTLTVAEIAPRAWQIIDCWGDATNLARIRDLSNACRIPETAR